jgi:AraC-like DNA-binding protein
MAETLRSISERLFSAGVDALDGLLDGPRARGAFLLRSLMSPPWSVRVQDRAPLSVVAIVRGDAWLVPDGIPPTRLGPGDVALLRGPDPYVFADDPRTPPQAVIHPGQRCTTPDGEELHDTMDLGVRSWGNDPSGSSLMLIGTYEHRSEMSRRLLSALPAQVVLSGQQPSSPVVSLLAEEIVKDEPGQHVVLDRLLDLVVIAVLRAWFGRPEADAPAWYVANGDPVVGRALRMLHNNPAHPWTVARLAAEVGVSRAALARRFTQLVGEAPMAFLTGWRLALAADLLHEPDAIIGAVARAVGYSSAFSLSTAFKRVYGVSPSRYRAGTETAMGSGGAVPGGDSVRAGLLLAPGVSA